ncbi:GntR family transcriptional regulator [Arthrobacter sp. B1805]|uniref:GntR family transcriptional regulator n=1 Tax=Arthrobacter sp. B1805 TaxID=2058892 RepID=UPI0015E373A9|nr:UTRA domain-containing protein [Arthrobacter sp. B1805]
MGDSAIQVLSLRRLRTADGVPIAVIHSLLPASTFAEQTAGSLHEPSLRAALGRHFGVQINTGKRRIRVVPGDGYLLRFLKLQVPSPVLLLEGTSFDQDGLPVEVVSTWHHPDDVVVDMGVRWEPVHQSSSKDVPRPLKYQPRCARRADASIQQRLTPLCN